jgi:arylesterase/paraoxonase
MRSGKRRVGDPYIGMGIWLAVVLFVMYVYPGFLAPVPSHFDGACRAIAMDAGAEDLRIDPVTGLAYLSYFENARPGPRRMGTGTVMLMDLNAAQPRVRAALATEPPHFAPSGLSLYVPASGPKRLFVVNRAELGTHSVEIFDQSATGAFTPVQTLRDRLFWSPTAIVAVGPKQFYVVNDAGFKDQDEFDARRYVVGKLRGSRGTVVYYDGEHSQIVAEGLGMPTGVALSPDGRALYVAESSERQLQVFDRDTTTGALKPTQRIQLRASPHNLTVDADGTILVTTHPPGSSFAPPVGGVSTHYPTQVLKVTPSAESGKQVSDVYTNDGSELSGGSIAAPHGNGFVIGSATDHKLLMCTRGAGAAAPAKPAISGPEKDD